MFIYAVHKTLLQDAMHDLPKPRIAVFTFSPFKLVLCKNLCKTL